MWLAIPEWEPVPVCRHWILFSWPDDLSFDEIMRTMSIVKAMHCDSGALSHRLELSYRPVDELYAWPLAASFFLTLFMVLLPQLAERLRAGRIQNA